MTLLYCLLATLIAPVGAANYDEDSADPAEGPSQSLDEVVVTGLRGQTDVRYSPFTVSVVDNEELNTAHRTNILPTIAEYVPGLSITQRGVLGYGVSSGGAGGINLRGLSSANGQVMVLIDGHPQYSGIYGHTVADSYHTLMADRVEVVRGPGSVVYGGNAMGGVINIVTRRSHTDGWHGVVNAAAGSYGTVQTEATVDGRSGKFSASVAGQYERSDNHRPRMGFEQYGGFMKLGYDFSAHWQARVDGDISHYNASYPGSVTKPIFEGDQWITRGAVNAVVDNNYGSTNGSISVYGNFGRHKINDGYTEGQDPQTRYFRSTDALVGVTAYESFRPIAHTRVIVGLDYQHIYGHAWYTDRTTGEVLETQGKISGKQSFNQVAGYLEAHRTFGEMFTVDAGIRYDNHSKAGGEWVPQGGVVFRPNSHSTIKATVGKGFRYPTMRELYLYPSSNEDLLPERLVNYELAWHQNLGRVSYGANVYYFHADNLIQTINYKNVNTGVVNNFGIEADAQWTVNKHWTLVTNHSWIHMQKPILSTPRYKGYIGAMFVSGRWTASAGVYQHCGLYINVTPDHELSESFTLLGATVGFRVIPALRLWVKGDNLLAQRYQTVEGYPMPRATFMAGFTLSI